METQERRSTLATRLYERELPGGGYVAIEVQRSPAGDRDTPVTRLRVERRHARDRRTGHEAPIIAELAGDEWSPNFTTIFQIARDNAAIARGLLDWQAERRSRAD